jgi:hypothetical protein
MGRWGKRAAPLALVAALLASLALACTALASEPLPIASLSPANGSTQTLGYRVPFELVSPSSKLSAVEVEVSTQNIPGQDGTLADDFQKDLIFLTKSDAYPTTYRGTSTGYGGGWESTPGTYYWQVSASEYSTEPPFAVHKYLSPVFTITIGTPPPVAKPPPEVAPLTLSESYGVVKGIIKERTHRTAHHLSDKCRSVSSRETRCKATWVSALRLSPNTVLYAGEFDLQARSDGIYFQFKGLRERWGCAQHHSSNHCSSKVHWP